MDITKLTNLFKPGTYQNREARSNYSLEMKACMVEIHNQI